MATIRQEKLAGAIIKNLHAVEPLNKQELVVSVGYSELSGEKKATEIIESKGTQEALRKRGFNSEDAKAVVAEILDKPYAEDKDRLKAAEIIFKVAGDFAAEKHINLNIEKKIISIDE